MASNLASVVSHDIQFDDATHKSEEPVSSTTLNACGLRGVSRSPSDNTKEISTYGVPIPTVPR